MEENSNQPDKQEKSGRNSDGTFVKGVSGNPNGRPKRKTLTELIHEKLDQDPNGWNELVEVIIKLAKGRDRDILKELWHYTDGMPKQIQKVDLEVSGDPLIIVKDGDKT